jgi:hypothetical protein
MRGDPITATNDLNRKYGIDHGLDDTGTFYTDQNLLRVEDAVPDGIPGRDGVLWLRVSRPIQRLCDSVWPTQGLEPGWMPDR